MKSPERQPCDTLILFYMTRDFPEVKVGRLGGRCPSLYNSLALPAAPPGIRTPVRRIIVECTDHKATPRLGDDSSKFTVDINVDLFTQSSQKKMNENHII
jgi:hypothetical protein